MRRQEVHKPLIVLLLMSLANPAQGETGSSTLTSSAVAATQKGREFLAGLYDRDVNLLPEFRGHHVYWLYHDNYIASKVLAESHPKISKALTKSIGDHTQHGSGKMEILFGEAAKPFPFRHFDLVVVRKVGQRIIRTEHVKKRPMVGWESYADLRFFAAIALAKSSPEKAKENFDAAMSMWDGVGLADAVTKRHKIYATYKLALAVIAAAKLQQNHKLPKQLLPTLRNLQAKSGGWITDYRPDGTPIGKANVETSCLCILALECDTE